MLSMISLLPGIRPVEIQKPRSSTPEIAVELRRLADDLQRLHKFRRDEREALQPILRRLVTIERALGLREKIEVPQATRRRPLGT